MKKTVLHNNWEVEKRDYKTSNHVEFKKNKIVRNVDINKLLNRIRVAEKNDRIKNLKFSISTIGVILIVATFLAY